MKTSKTKKEIPGLLRFTLTIQGCHDLESHSKSFVTHHVSD